jgi:hypothetical protein
VCLGYPTGIYLVDGSGTAARIVPYLEDKKLSLLSDGGYARSESD